MENLNVKKLSDIEAKPILRNRTWFEDLDYMYGTSNTSENSLGMPKGKISLWAGESGVGKSRLCIQVAKMFSINYSNGTVLYIQTESPLEDFAGWTKDTKQYDRIYCSGADQIDDIIKIIYDVKPKLIFIDSVNEIEDFTGNAKSVDRLIKGEGNKIGLKQAVNDVGAHCILLGQLNQDGKTIKGGTSLPHAVDVALNVVLVDPINGLFKVEVGVKNRYGKRDKIAQFQHTNDGVIAVEREKTKEEKDREFQEYDRKFRNSPEGKAYIKERWEANAHYRIAAEKEKEKERKAQNPGVYRQIGNLLGDMFGK